MNKISLPSVVRGSLTALLICAASVVDQAKMSVNKTITRSPPITEKTIKNKLIVADVKEMEEQYETYCEIEKAEILYDSLLSNAILSDLTERFNRKEYQDTLFAQHPEAKPFAATIKTGTYLREAKKNYKEYEDIILTFFPNGWGYSRYQKFNRDLTQHAWKKNLLNKDEFLFINDTYISFLMSFVQKNSEFKTIITSESKKKGNSVQELPRSGMFATIRDTIREQEITVGGKKIQSKHYPANDVYNAITALGHSIYSSKEGEIKHNTPDCLEGGCTALTGAQLDILIPGLEGLRQKIWEELENLTPGKYSPKDIIFTIRGLTEAGHSFSINKKKNQYSGIIAGQLDPSYNNNLNTGGETDISSKRINNITQLYATHGRLAYDIGNDCEYFWVMQRLMKKSPKYKIGNTNYSLLDLGNGLTAPLNTHGNHEIKLEEDLLFHGHGGFIPNHLLKN